MYFDRVARVLGETAGLARSAGLLPALRVLARRCLRVQSMLVYEATTESLQSPGDAPLTVCRMSADELRARATEISGAGLGNVPDNDVAGESCYVALDDGEVLGVGWRHAQGTLLQVAAPGEVAVYLGDFVVAPRARGRGIYPAMLRHMGRDGLEPATRVLVEVAEDNDASRRGLDKAGFSCVGRLRLVSVLGVVIHHRLLPMGAG